MADILESGVYFGLDSDAYHAVPALSSSGIKWLSVSTMDYWARTPWLNPNYRPDDETEFQELGSAYHARILEGRDVFYRQYAAALDPADYPDALRTMNEMRDALKANGIEKGLSKYDKTGLIDLLARCAPAVQIWDTIESEYAAFHKGKTLLHPDSIARIEIAAAMIERHSDLSKCFRGGAPEVTVLWTDEETGVKCKVRFDYIKSKAAIDLKSFSNPLGKNIDDAIYAAIAGRKYFIQSAHYLSAVPYMKAFAGQGRVFGDGPTDMLSRLSDDPQWVWVFMQTGIAPLARGKVFPAGLVRDIGKMIVRTGIETYKRCMDTYGTELPWIDEKPIEALDDAGFPAYVGR